MLGVLKIVISRFSLENNFGNSLPQHHVGKVKEFWGQKRIGGFVWGEENFLIISNKFTGSLVHFLL